jgi:hypothetical protein
MAPSISINRRDGWRSAPASTTTETILRRIDPTTGLSAITQSFIGTKLGFLQPSYRTEPDHSQMQNCPLQGCGKALPNWGKNAQSRPLCLEACFPQPGGNVERALFGGKGFAFSASLIRRFPLSPVVFGFSPHSHTPYDEWMFFSV